MRSADSSLLLNENTPFLALKAVNLRALKSLSACLSPDITVTPSWEEEGDNYCSGIL